MRDFLAGWLVVQLFVVGFAYGIGYAQSNNGTLDCSYHKKPEIFSGLLISLVPIIAFTPSPHFCQEQEAMMRSAESHG